MSWCWAYYLQSVVSAVEGWLHKSGEDPHDVFLWMCFFCNNQYRIKEEVPQRGESWQWQQWFSFLHSIMSLFRGFQSSRSKLFDRSFVVDFVFENSQKRKTMKIMLLVDTSWMFGTFCCFHFERTNSDRRPHRPAVKISNRSSSRIWWKLDGCWCC